MVKTETKQEYKGDSSWCKTCQSNTVYEPTGCAVCGISTGENKLKYNGELNYLRQKYPGY